MHSAAAWGLRPQSGGFAVRPHICYNFRHLHIIDDDDDDDYNDDDNNDHDDHDDNDYNDDDDDDEYMVLQ